MIEVMVNTPTRTPISTPTGINGINDYEDELAKAFSLLTITKNKN